MLTINAPIFDINGSLVIQRHEQQGLAGGSRRVNRVATLDGAAAISDFGYTDSDKTLEIVWPSSKAEYQSAGRMLRSYSRVIVSYEDGCFLCAPLSISVDDNSARLTLLVDRKLNQ